MSDEDLEPLDEELAGLFAAERGRGTAAPGSKARVLARLAGSIPGGGGDSGGGSSGTATGTATATGIGKLAPILAAFVIGAGAGAGTLLAVRPPTVVYVDRPTATGSVAALASAPPEDVALGLAPTTIAPEPGPGTSASASSGAPSGSARDDAALAREREILDIARTALGRGDGAHALEAVDRHAREFPRGQMTEEREAIAVQALAKLGRHDEAEARATRFRKHYPNSVLLPVIDAATNLK